MSTGNPWGQLHLVLSGGWAGVELGPRVGVAVVYGGERGMSPVLLSLMEMSLVMLLMMEMSLVLTTWLQCQNQGNCHPVTGNCHCPMGWTVSCHIEIKPLAEPCGLTYLCTNAHVSVSFLHVCPFAGRSVCKPLPFRHLPPRLQVST